MMNIDLGTTEKINTGGGEVYVLTKEQGEQLINGAKVNGDTPIYTELLEKKWGIVKDEPLLDLALQNNLYTRNQWCGLVVVKYEKSYKRIDLQTSNCLNCDWEGWAGTPLCFDLYVGSTEEASGFFEEAKELAVLGCPCCGGTLSKHAIWVQS